MAVWNLTCYYDLIYTILHHVYYEKKLIKVIYNSNKKYFLREKRVCTFYHISFTASFRLWKLNSCQFKYMKCNNFIHSNNYIFNYI